MAGREGIPATHSKRLNKFPIEERKKNKKTCFVEKTTCRYLLCGICALWKQRDGKIMEGADAVQMRKELKRSIMVP
jgi:hypothetical protein